MRVYKSRSYGSGFFSGEEYLDRVTLSPHLVIENQSIGVASKSQGLDPGVDGILGFVALFYLMRVVECRIFI